MRTLACCLLALAALPFSEGRADVYKWIDASGAVHYSSEKPADVSRATRIDSTMVNVYTPQSHSGTRVISSTTTTAGVAPMPPPPGLGPPPSSGAPQALQPMPSMQPMAPMGGYPSAQPDAAQLAQWRAQCEREMWADCDDPRALAARYAMGYPPVVIVRPTRPLIVPTAPSTSAIPVTPMGPPAVPPQAGVARPTPHGIPSRPRNAAEYATH